MTTLIHAPYPGEKVTIILPSAEFDDSRTPEEDVTVKRSMLGRVVTYVRSSPRLTLGLTLELSRMKSLELDAFLRIYYRAPWRLVMHDGTEWSVRLIGEPIQRTTTARTGDTEGGELTEVRLTLSGTRI